MMRDRALTFLHPDSSLSKVKIALFETLTTEQLLMTLVPGTGGCLKARPDGTVLDGHHRLYVLRARGVDIHALPREIVEKTGL
jgi:hypothetical protein